MFDSKTTTPNAGFTHYYKRLPLILRWCTMDLQKSRCLHVLSSIMFGDPGPKQAPNALHILHPFRKCIHILHPSSCSKGAFHSDHVHRPRALVPGDSTPSTSSTPSPVGTRKETGLCPRVISMGRTQPGTTKCNISCANRWCWVGLDTREEGMKKGLVAYWS